MRRFFVWSALAVVLALLPFVVVAQTGDGAGDVPWAGISISWAALVSVVISTLKRFGLPSAAAPYVTVILGGVGIFLAQVLSGEATGAALVNALIALFGAPGVYEMILKPLRRKVTGE